MKSESSDSEGEDSISSHDSSKEDTLENVGVYYWIRMQLSDSDPREWIEKIKELREKRRLKRCYTHKF